MKASPVRKSTQQKVLVQKRDGKISEESSGCFESGRFSALRYRSTKAAPSFCLAVFPSHMDSAEYVSVLDPQEFFSQIQLTSSEEI